MTVKINQAEKLIIRDIAKSQIASLTRIYTNQTGIDIELRRIGYDVTRNQLDLEIARVIDLYEDIKSNPGNIFALDLTQMILVKDHLLDYADEYKVDYPGHIETLWYKVDLAIWCLEHIN